MSRGSSRGGVFATTRGGLVKRVSVVAFAAVGVVACGSTASVKAVPASLFNPSTFNTSNVPWLAANQNAKGTPVMGGTLQIEGSTDLSAAGDPQGEYETIGFTLERAYTRQLLSYAASTNLTTAETLVPDAAASLPTVCWSGWSPGSGAWVLQAATRWGSVCSLWRPAPKR